MACFHPLKAVQYKTVCYASGKGRIRILRKDEDPSALIISGEAELIQLPCGQCTGCRMDYARQWANRLMLEYESYANDPSSCHFITLTIDPVHIDDDGQQSGRRGDLPKLHVLRPYADHDTGLLLGWSHSVSKIDFQLFMKRLRRQHENDRIRFFGCGEYGSDSCRPHYHLIVFGLHFEKDDLVFYKKSPLGYNYMNSKSLSEIWPYGYNVVAPCTWESCCYVARYMMKKQKGEGRKIYDQFNIEEPFTLMSRRPGLAHEYYENHKLDTETSRIVIGTEQGSRSFPPPRYLEKLFELDDPESAEIRKERRRNSAKAKQDILTRRSNLTSEEYLAKQEEKFLHAVKFLDSYRNL